MLAARGHAAAEAGAWAQAAALLRDALALWRGDPLADVPSQLLRHREVPSSKTSGCKRWSRGSTPICIWGGTVRSWQNCASWSQLIPCRSNSTPS